MNDYFKSYLQYKTLEHRFRTPFDGNTIDELLRGFETKAFTDENGDQVEETVINERLKLQNVCAKMPVQLVRRLEATLEVLSMSKREFIELAIITAIEEAERIFAENGVAIPEYDDGSEESDR
jgi:hypothetical protein